MLELCVLQDRLAYGQVHGIAPDRKGTQGSAAAALLRLFPAPSGGAARRRRRGGRGTDADRNDADEARDNEEVYAGNRCAHLLSCIPSLVGHKMGLHFIV